MRKREKLIVIAAMFLGCKKPYTPPAVANTPNYLVVEGVINVGADSTIIKLSRTYKLAGSEQAKPETGAALLVESNDNTTEYPLFESKIGYYTAVGLNFNTSKKYRLKITTADKEQYLSDFSDVKVTPPIDSVGFVVQNSGLQIYVNTHDPKNDTHYYRWDYVETWRFNAKYSSEFISNGSAILPRRADQLIYYCYANHAASTIVLGSSAKLQQDVIFQNPILSIESTSEKIETKYSILLRQYGMTPDAYKFYSTLKKNTEQLGSIFDAEPSELTGNVHNVKNPKEPVIGYVSACTVQTKRIFISNDQVPPEWRPKYPFDCGPLDSAYFNRPKTGENETLDLIPLPPIGYPVRNFYIPGGGGFPAGYLYSTSRDCIDCTIRGFVKQPDFWK